MASPEFQQRLRETFRQEATEHIGALVRDAATLEPAAPDRAAVVERIFRETHTLKGAARMVGEAEAEALCHALEQELSALKSGRVELTASGAAGIRDSVARIASVLNLTPSPRVETSAPAEPRPVSGPPFAGQARVPAERLAGVLRRTEELHGARLSGEQHVAALRALGDRSMAWKREFERVRPHLGALRRAVDAGGSGAEPAQVASLLHHLDWIHEYLRELQGDVRRLGRSTAADQRRLGAIVDGLLGEAKELLTQPFAVLFESLPGFVQDIAAREGKEIDVVIEGAATEIDRRILDEIKDALIHLLRNGVDHGFERADEREARGKPRRGTLSIGVRNRTGGVVEISIADDGRGIDHAEVTAHARRLGLIDDDVGALAESDAFALLFRSGFSTRTAASELSGRGLGLAIAREKIEQLGGSLSVESTKGRGTTFFLRLPLTLARFRALFVSVQGRQFALPCTYAQRALRRKPSELTAVKNQRIVTIDGQPIVVRRMAELLGLPPGESAPKTADSVCLVVIESGRSRAAFEVDGVPQEREIVVKGLGRQLRGARQYIGATLAEDGLVVPVLSAGPLLAAAHLRRAPVRPAAAAAPATRRTRTILVAEDSITSRSLLKGILQAAGFEVKTAVDGADALTTLKYESVDLVISDVQMPRLDGFELTARIRADKRLSTLPVILVTSLASREDRERGVDAGANAYIVKSSFDQSDLLAVIGRLLP